jgi:hypothetical protein
MSRISFVPRKQYHPAMPPCIHCTELWDVYTNLRFKYRIAVAVGKVSVDDINALCDASELARRNFEEHKVTHNPAPRVIVTEAPRAADIRPSQTTAILLPPATAR